MSAEQFESPPFAADIEVQHGDLVFTLNVHGRIAYWNKEAAEAFGYTAAEAQGIPFDVLYRPRSLLSTEHRIDLKAVMSGRDFAGGVECLRKDGGKLALYVYATAARDESGEVVGVTCVARDVTGFWRAERAVRSSLERYRLLFDCTSDIVLLLSPEGVIVEANRAASQTSGYPVEDLIGKSIFDLVPSEKRRAAETVFAELRHKRMLRTVFEFDNRLGGTVLVELNVSALDAEDGKFVFAIGRDVTERLQAERAVLESEEKYREIFAAVTDAMFLETIDGRILDVNEGACRLLAYGRSELLDRRVRDLVPEDARSWLPQIPEVLMRRGEFRGEGVYVRKDGSEVPVELSCSLVELGGVRLVLAVARDISERRGAERLLRESEENFRALAENASDGFLITDREGRFVYANARAAALLGYGTGELLGVLFTDLARPGAANEISELQRKRLEDESVPNRYEVVAVRKDGTEMEVGVAAAVTTWKGQPATFVVFRDITERKRAEETLRESELRYRTALNSMWDAAHVVDKEMRIVLFNLAFRRWNEKLGLETEVLGRNLYEVFPFLSDKVKEEYARVFKSGESVVTEENIRLGEEDFVTETRKTPVFDKGKVLRVLTVIRNITAQKRDGVALRESEERFRRLVEFAPDGISVHQDGRIVMVNPAGARLLGYDSPEGLVGQSVMETVHPDDRDRVAARVRAAMERGESGVLIEERFKRKDGSYVWVEVVNSPYVWGGRPAVQVVVRGIAERRRLAAELRELAAHMQAVFDSLPHGVAAERGGRMVLVNRAFAGSFGYEEPEELVGMSTAGLVAPEDRDRVAVLVRDWGSGVGGPLVYGFKALRRDGLVVPMRSTLTVYEVSGRSYVLRTVGAGSGRA